MKEMHAAPIAQPPGLWLSHLVKGPVHLLAIAVGGCITFHRVDGLQQFGLLHMSDQHIVRGPPMPQRKAVKSTHGCVRGTCKYRARAAHLVQQVLVCALLCLGQQRLHLGQLLEENQVKSEILKSVITGMGKSMSLPNTQAPGAMPRVL